MGGHFFIIPVGPVRPSQHAVGGRPPLHCVSTVSRRYTVERVVLGYLSCSFRRREEPGSVRWLGQSTAGPWTGNLLAVVQFG